MRAFRSRTLWRARSMAPWLPRFRAAPMLGLFSRSDGTILFDGDSNRAVRAIDPEGFISTVARVQSETYFRSMAPGPNDSTYLMANDLGVTPNASSVVLSRLSSVGEIVWLSSAARGSAAAIRPGRSVGEVALDGVGDAIAYDSLRGLLYLWDSGSRRVLVIGEPSTVLIDSNPPGQRVVVDGTAVETPRQFRWLPGEYHSVEAAESAGTEPFTGWSHEAGRGRSVTWMPPVSWRCSGLLQRSHSLP